MHLWNNAYTVVWFNVSWSLDIILQNQDRRKHSRHSTFVIWRLVKPKASLHVQAICANMFAQIAWRLLQTVQAFGLLKLRCDFFKLLPWTRSNWINFWAITYFFSTLKYFSLYLFSNLAFCSFFLFLLLYSVLATHHSAGSVLYSSIHSIKNCRSSAVRARQSVHV